MAGKNSILSLGTDDLTNARNAFAKSGLTWGSGTGQVNSVVYVDQPIRMASRGVVSAIPEADNINDISVIPSSSVTFSNGSVLMVNGRCGCRIL